jgi:ribosomal protein S18 acetylase RimI-like enzyme
VRRAGTALSRQRRGGRAASARRYLRFASAKPRLSERELDTLTELDRHNSDALLATDPRWQGRGLGTALLARLIERARNEGHPALRATVLAENKASIAMLRRAGFASRSGAGALREFELAVTPRAPSAALGARRANQ